ncbi:MAG: glycosyltransferase family 2 protein [Acidobacteria bacterium]|nr:glycosyltransferase family 2 protein [Acidobacteriota bacterium]
MNQLFGFCLLALSIPAAYLSFLALAAIPTRRTRLRARPTCRFAIAIPAHDEETVIGRTVAALRQSDYPAELFDLFVVADNCSDCTARTAQEAGALVLERNEAPRGKGPALRWLFRQILRCERYDAVVVFDADTRVTPDFLRVMDACLAEGHDIIQGQHRILNPGDGWFPMLAWAMFLADNRLQNQSRSNLGLSAKNMGDSICFRADLLRRFGWGEGLTDDYAFRQQLLLEGFRIRYEPSAVGYGEAALSWRIACTQRARWLRGTYEADRRHIWRMLHETLCKGNLAALDGALQACLPSYSTLTVLALAIAFIHAFVSWLGYAEFSKWWLVLLCVLVVYPFWGLALERAPARAHLAILSGPLFVIWRTWIAVTARYLQGKVEWVRTPRKGTMEPPAMGHQ